MVQNIEKKQYDLGIVFPGLTFLSPTKGLEEFSNYSSAAKNIIDEANNVSGIDLIQLTREGVYGEFSIKDLGIAQFIIPVYSMASYEILRDRLYKNNTDLVFGGHSLGEFTMLYNAADLNPLLRLIKDRGATMAHAQGALAVLRDKEGRLDIQLVKQVCEASGTYLALVNSPAQMLISGTAENISNANKLLAENNLTAKILNNMPPTHSPLLAETQNIVENLFPLINFRLPERGLTLALSNGVQINSDGIINETGDLITDLEMCRQIVTDYYLKHTISTFNFTNVVRQLPQTVIECGPKQGGLLGDFIKACRSEINYRCVSDLQSLTNY